MRASAWVTILGLAGLAVACGDQPTEVVPDREANRALVPGGGVQFATSSSGDGYSITTDKDDYQPGDTLHLTGAGWDPGDMLDIVLTDEPQTHPPHEWTVSVEEDGTFHDATYVVDEGDLDVRFTLVATSQSTDQSLTVNFTDANISNNVGVSPASISIAPGSTTSYTLTITFGGNATSCNVTFTVSGLPTGVGSFSPTSVSGTTGDTKTVNLNIATSAGTAANTYNFTVTAVAGSGCNAGNRTGNGTLIVYGPATHLGFGQQPSNTVSQTTVTPSPTVLVLDANENVVANSTLSIGMAIGTGPSGAVLSGTLTRAAVNGVATFPGLSIDKSGAYRLSATSGLLTGSSDQFSITAGTATKLQFIQQPSDGAPGVVLTTQPRVAVTDAVGNIKTSGPGSTTGINLTITPGTGTGALSCTTNPLNTSAGIATFAGCKVSLAGTNYQLRASGGGFTLVDSDPFEIINPDHTAPTVNCTVPDVTIWYATDVQVPCTASDPSGLAVPANASFTLSTSVPAGTEDPTALTSTLNVCDALNNCVLKGFTFKVDKKAPVVVCGSADNAWHSANVSIACTASDDGAGLATSGDASFNLVTTVAKNSEDPDASTGSRNVADAVGNAAPAGPITGNKIDMKAPAFSCGTADGAWHASDVSIACTASDGGSGLVNAGDASFNLVTNVAANTEVSNASTNFRELKDAVGHTATAGPIAGNKVDKKAPTVDCDAPDGNWHGADAGISCTASDGGSGLKDAGDASFDLATNVPDGTENANASTTSRPILDDVGNSSTAGPIAGIKVDRKKPVVTCGTADGNWHADNVSIHCTATDGGSGLDVAGDASFNLVTSVAVDNETANAETDSRDVADKVGNKQTAGPVGSNKIDKKAPQFTCEAAPAAWSANDVTRDCIAVDGGSGLDPESDNSFSLHTSVLADNETADAQTGSKQLADAVGNKRTAGPLGNNKVDKKNPQIACDDNDGQWHADNVSIACTGSDGGSGLADNDDASFNLLTTVAANTETDNASTGTRSVADVVGHTVTAGPVSGNKVDKKAPVVTCGSADNAWHGSNVAIGCTSTDGGSGLKVSGDASFNLVTSVAMGDETSTASTNSKPVLDDVGNSSTAGPIGNNKIDRKAPQVACGSADGIWHAADVAIGCTATDGGSGLANATDASFNLNTAVGVGTETATAATNSRYVVDDVGNSATAGPVPNNKIDKKGPTLSLTCPNSPLLLNQPNVLASWTAADGGSGVAAGFTAGSFGVSTNPAGPHSVFAAAGLSHDAVGNTSSASAACGYTVSYGFLGFTTPVDMNNVMNGANSGQAIPLKWTLKDFNGAPVTTLTNVNVTAITLNCAQGSTADLIEEYASGASGLINKGDGSYQFNWKTPTSYARSCKTLRLDLGEGTTQNPVYHVAMFEFKK